LNVLQLLEVGQALFVRPADVAIVGPVVEVVLAAAHVDHRVDGVRAADDLSAPPV